MNEAVLTALDRPRSAAHDVQDHRPAGIRARSLPAPGGSVVHPHAHQDLRDGGAPAPSLWDRYPEAGRAIRDALGPREALELARRDRDETTLTLRVRHRWSLQAIGDLFDFSRERIRQQTPASDGNGRTPDLVRRGKPCDPTVTRLDLVQVFRIAARNASAWNGHGKISKSWVVEKLGHKPQQPAIDFRSPAQSKAEFIVPCGIC